MKKNLYMLAAVLAFAGCGNRSGLSASGEDMIENGKIGYADIVSFIVQGYQCGWNGMSPEDQGLSPVYSYSSEYAGFAEKDINGDGIPELLIGDRFENGDYLLYDIFTINPADGSLIHLAKGGERDTFKINTGGVIIEDGSNSASDSFTKMYRIKNGKLVKSKAMTLEDSPMDLEMETFESLARKGRQPLCGGYTDAREPSDEEYQLFRKVTDAMEGMTFTPLTVQTQVVAGINYRFYCRFSDGSEEYSPGHCWLTIFKPLPGRGEPEVTSIERTE